MTDRTSTAPSRGKVLWHLTMSLDGFIASPSRTLDWMAALDIRPGVVDEAVATCGAILGGRRGYDEGAAQAPGEASSLPYGGAWQGPIFVLTHHLEDAIPDPGVTFLNCDVAEAVETGWQRRTARTWSSSVPTSPGSASSGACSTRSTSTSRQ